MPYILEQAISDYLVNPHLVFFYIILFLLLGPHIWTILKVLKVLSLMQ